MDAFATVKGPLDGTLATILSHERLLDLAEHERKRLAEPLAGLHSVVEL